MRFRSGTLFLSYRRSDSPDAVGRIYDRLVDHYGAKRIFKDVDRIPAGANFEEHLSNSLLASDVLLVVIGPGWIDARSAAGGRRLDEPHDYVRVEIELAFAHGLIVIPVLVGGSAMPEAEALPASIRPLVLRQAVQVRRDPDFHRDFSRLLQGIAEALQLRRRSRVRGPVPGEHRQGPQAGSGPPIAATSGELPAPFPAPPLPPLRPLPAVAYFGGAADGRVEARGRRVLRGAICLSLATPVVLQLMLVVAMIAWGVLSHGADSTVFKSNVWALALGYLLLSLGFLAVLFYSWRRRIWAIITATVSLSLLPAAVLASCGGDIAVDFGSPFKHDWGFLPRASSAALLLALFCLPALGLAVVAVMECEPQTGWLRALWRPLACRRPRWLAWLRRSFLAACGIWLLAGAVDAMVADVRRRTPLNPAEEPFAAGSWEVVESASYPDPGWFTHGRWDRGIVWTFSRDRRVEDGRTNDSHTAFQEGSGFFSDSPNVSRWKADPDTGQLTLSALRDGSKPATYTISGQAVV